MLIRHAIVLATSHGWRQMQHLVSIPLLIVAIVALAAPALASRPVYRGSNGGTCTLHTDVHPPFAKQSTLQGNQCTLSNSTPTYVCGKLNVDQLALACLNARGDFARS
ncbi:uncharacterized protein PSFLO_07183 [Pseudozyma flocculosa]|nr:uncharacterized protein PSFLO_07183 [Pseudozyma flocculosa]